LLLWDLSVQIIRLNADIPNGLKRRPN
jgi:hypothetical protein